MEEGTRVHQLAQDFVEGKIKKLPEELSAFPDKFKLIKRVKAQCELEWAFTASWEPCEWKSKSVWLRVKTDATFVQCGVRMVIDYKTGKIYPDHPLQLELYALASFIMHREDTVECADWYIDQRVISEKQRWYRDDLPKLKEDWAKRVGPMMRDTIFPARPGYACKWCHFRKANGGPCSF